MLRLSQSIFSGLVSKNYLLAPTVKFVFSEQEARHRRRNPDAKYFKHFPSKADIRKAIAQVAQTYQIPEQVAKSYFKEYPAFFKPDSPKRKQLHTRIQFLENTAKQKKGTLEGEVAEVFRSIVFKNRVLGFNFSPKTLLEVFKKIEQVGMTKEQVRTIFTVAPHALHVNFVKVLDEKLKICKDYLKIDTKEALQIFQACPVLLPSSNNKFRTSIAELIRTYHYTYAEVIHLMKSLGEIFLFNGIVLHDLHKLPKEWGLTGPETKKLFQDHPLLFFNYPYEILPLKVKIIRYLMLPQYCGKLIFQKYPQIMIFSVSSLQSKVVFLKNRLKMNELFDFQAHSPQILLSLLTFKFNKTLRPRCQLLIKSRYEFNINNILSLIEMPQEKFVNQIGISKQRLEQQKNKFPITQELDYFRKKAFENTNLKEKLKKMAEEKYQK